MRKDGRKFDELRPVKITVGFVKFAEGSVLMECGDTKVLCCASVEDRVPPHVRPGCGWVTAEYSMLPRANRERSQRDVSKLKLAGRSAEIQRLIGRSLRAVVDMEALGEMTITVDCDVLQGDGGTRCASITGGFVALALACRKAYEQRWVRKYPILDYVAALSTGIVPLDGRDSPIIDMCYEEDSSALADFNLVMLGSGAFVEVQGTGEGRPYTREELDNVVKVTAPAIEKMIAAQKAILEG